MKSILIIEDDEMISEMYTDKLKFEGYTVLTAQNGEEGLKMALENHPDLILLDILMPKKDGIALMNDIRKDTWGENVPIIIITNLNPDGQVLREIIKDHPAYCIMKANSTPDDIVQKVSELLST